MFTSYVVATTIIVDATESVLQCVHQSTASDPIQNRI